jgi:hypothetical protein
MPTDRAFRSGGAGRLMAGDMVHHLDDDLRYGAHRLAAAH